jgi:hypothetical protein
MKVDLLSHLINLLNCAAMADKRMAPFLLQKIKKMGCCLLFCR